MASPDQHHSSWGRRYYLTLFVFRLLFHLLFLFIRGSYVKKIIALNIRCTYAHELIILTPEAHVRESTAYRSCHVKLQTIKVWLDLSTRSRVITMKQNGLNYREIQRHLEEEDTKISLRYPQ